MARAMKDSGIEWIGEIPEGWSVVSLGRLFSASAGGDAKQELYSDYQDETHPYPVYTNTLSKDQVYAYTTTPFFQSNTITVTGRGAIGHAFYRDTPYDAIIRLLSLCPKQTLNCRFYAYWIDTVIPFFTDSAAIGQLSAIQITKYKTLFLPLREQDKISEYLDIECSKINTIIEQTRASIEEYKKLKQSVITQAVTKGIRPGRRMVNSGVDWIGQIPDEWAVFRIANLYDERNERGMDDLPILTVSINTGISDHEIPDEEKDRVVVRSEDRTLYKRVCPGDLAYNMMRAWQGAFGAARVDGMVSPAYVVAKPKTPGILDSRYIEALLRTPAAVEEMHRYSRGITDFRLRLYWPEFKNICVCVPSIKEQIEIADYIDAKAAEIDALIQKKQQFLVELESYKKSLIFEYVTGKKEVL